MKKMILLSEEKIVSRIYLVRGKKVMLDKDLAEMYRVGTGHLNQAVKRNARRFPVKNEPRKRVGYKRKK